MLFIDSPIKKDINIYFTYLASSINDLADIDNRIRDINIVKLFPNLPSIPQKLVFISLEKIVDKSIDNRSKNIPASNEVFIILNFPSHISFIVSKPIIIVENPKIQRDIDLSLQSHEKGIIHIGKTSIKANKRNL